MRKFDLVEVRENNIIQVRYLDEEATAEASARRFHRVTTHSDDPRLGEYPELVQKLARAFPLDLDFEPDGVVVTLIRVLAADQTKIRYDVSHFVNGVREKKPAEVVGCLDCVEGLPEKVQKVARVVFNGEVIEAEKQRIESEKRQKVITIPVVVDGKPVMEDYEAEETKIEVVEGKAVQRKITVIKQRPKTQEVPVFDEDGNPVYE